MQHAIDPKIDCVFKALLGSEENRNLLLHFINAILLQELSEPLVWVDILNPYNDKEFLSDKLSIVDVKAKDSQGRLYQIEVQLSHYGYLAERILYNWADLYSQQLKSGQNYNELESTYSIWLLSDNLLLDDSPYLHQYKMRDEMGLCLNQHGGIWILELNKFEASPIETEAQRWLKFFKDGEQLNDTTLPDWMSTLEMKQAMHTLSLFSEKEREYFQYQARQEFLREQRTKEFERQSIQLELEKATRNLEQTHQELEQAHQELEQSSQKLEQFSRELLNERLEKSMAKQREEAALAEISRLQALLANKESKTDE